MNATNNDIIARLQKDILSLQGFKSNYGSTSLQFGLGSLQRAFPNNNFPTGAIHEFISNDAESTAASTGFISGLLSTLMQNSGACVWINSSTTLFPPALKNFGIQPDHIIFIELQKEKDMLWVMEEALKCNGLAAVVGEIREISLTASRRLQLAVEQSRVTGFLLRNRPRKLDTIASVARWRIKSIASHLENNLPGVGFPRWQVELLKVRNGKPGIWEMEWRAGKFRHLSPYLIAIPGKEQRKTG